MGASMLGGQADRYGHEHTDRSRRSQTPADQWLGSVGVAIAGVPLDYPSIPRLETKATKLNAEAALLHQWWDRVDRAHKTPSTTDRRLSRDGEYYEDYRTRPRRYRMERPSRPHKQRYSKARRGDGNNLAIPQDSCPEHCSWVKDEGGLPLRSSRSAYAAIGELCTSSVPSSQAPIFMLMPAKATSTNLPSPSFTT